MALSSAARKTSSFGARVLIVLIALIIVISPSSALADNLSTESWVKTTAYPTAIWTSSCVTDAGYIYCVGGLTGRDTVKGVASAVYYAPLSSEGLGAWTQTTAYPSGVRAESCVANAGFIYCVGGYANSVLSDAVYFAPLSAAGVGQWTATTSYPTAVWTHSCAASSDGIYCIGGITPVQNESSLVYFAPFSGSGLGQWTNATSYPVGVMEQSCVIRDTDIYCIGGYASTAVYYAPLTSGGLGTWTQSKDYPFSVGVDTPSCVVTGTFIYCIGGYTGPVISNAVHYAAVSPAGVGQWFTASTYPVGVWGESCVSSGGIYCVGGGSAANAVLSSTYYLAGSTSTQSGSTQVTSSSATGSATSTVTTTSSSSSASSATSPSTSAGGVPEFPYQFFLAVVMTVLLAASYLFVRRQRVRIHGKET